MKQPCKDCVDREVGCHSKCSKYKEFKVWLEEHKPKPAMCTSQGARQKHKDKTLEIYRRKRNGEYNN